MTGKVIKFPTAQTRIHGNFLGQDYIIERDQDGSYTGSVVFNSRPLEFVHKGTREEVENWLKGVINDVEGV